MFILLELYNQSIMTIQTEDFFGLIHEHSPHKSALGCVYVLSITSKHTHGTKKSVAATYANKFGITKYGY